MLGYISFSKSQKPKKRMVQQDNNANTISDNNQTNLYNKVNKNSINSSTISSCDEKDYSRKKNLQNAKSEYSTDKGGDVSFALMNYKEIVDIDNLHNIDLNGINRAQLTLQELQDLAERQRQQILYNSKELMDKQQQLMRMHQDFRTRLKLQGQSARPVNGEQEPQSTSQQPPKSPISKRDQDQYARMLRETYQSMGKMQKRNNFLNEIDVRKFSNVELAHELEKVRSIFSSKQNELAKAVRKVDVLTHQLDQRKNGDGASVPTPERINRRKKIQAAKDELDRLRNELIVRNEMNSQQSHQLQLQRDIIHEKQQELRHLHTRMNELGTALKNKKEGNRHEINRQAPNQALFNSTYLQDTLRRKTSSGNNKVDINSNNVDKPEPIGNVTVNGSANQVEQNNNNNKSVFKDTPLSANQIWRSDSVSSSQVPSPSSSVSSLSSLSLSSFTPDDLSKPYALKPDSGPPPPPPRTTPLSVLVDNRSSTSTKSVASEEFIENLRLQKQRIDNLQEELKNTTSNIKISSYTDSTLSGDSDNIPKYENYRDATNSSTTELLKTKGSKPVPPVLKPKPIPKPRPPTKDEDKDFVDRANVKTSETPVFVDTADKSNFSVFQSKDTKEDEKRESQDSNSWPPQPGENDELNGPSEPDEFELSFADIDEINDLQTDVWSNSGSTVSHHSFDSDSDNINDQVVPVIISVSPDKMPPPILMKPDKPRKPKRNIVLDPFALLLDSALEGELEHVKEILKEVPDPSKPNAEGITALHNAVCGNHKDVVKYLVEVACDVNSADNNGWTPLHCAAFYNDTELCSFLVEHGANVFATTYTDHQTPAHKCSQLDENYDVCFGYLHECKENVGRINNGLVHALYDYAAENEDELSFYSGEELTVLRRGDGNEKDWWWAKNRQNETGYIPHNLVGNFPRIAAEV